MINKKNRTIYTTLKIWYFVEAIIFGITFSNSIYWGFIGAYFSQNIIIYSIILTIGIIAIFEHTTKKQTKCFSYFRFVFGSIMVILFSLFQYLGLMSIYLPRYKNKIFNNLFMEITNQEDILIAKYKIELFNNISYIEPSTYYMGNVWEIANSGFSVIITIVVLIISIFSIVFIMKYIDKNTQYLEIFIDKQLHKYKISSKYSNKVYEAKKQTETLSYVLDDLYKKIKKRS